MLPLRFAHIPEFPPVRRGARRGVAPSCVPRASLASLLLPTLAVIGVLSGPASAQLVPQPLPVGPALETFVGSGDVKAFRIDLGSLPNRPGVRVDVIPDPSHPDLQTEIVFKNFLPVWPGGPNGGCPMPTDTFDSLDAGVHVFQYGLTNCEPRIDPPFSPPFYVGLTLDVEVRVVGFGTNPGPADAWISVRGVTIVPSNSYAVEVEDDLTPQTVTLPASKDTVLYERVFANSNGSGTSLWAGTDYSTLFILGGSILRFWDDLRPLVAFDIADAVPVNSTITSASLSLYANAVEGGGGAVRVFEVEESGIPNVSWREGVATPDDEFVGESGGSFAANWLNRENTVYPWATPGGDLAGSAIASLSVTGPGYKTFSTAALDVAVEKMATDRTDENGFVIIGPGGFSFFDRAVSFRSREWPLTFQQPRLTFTYTPNGPYVDGLQLQSGTKSFISEGQNFRWIYDTDDDGVFVTDIGGVCEELAPENGPKFVPYTYAYTGAPFTGIDCCTWSVDSPETGTIGTGQALFYHNLDPNDPQNTPPDVDGDGIQDGCDNCWLVPNGPLRGVCVGPGGLGSICLSDAECGPSETCDLSQSDADADGYGDACPVPEPGYGLGLLFGGGVLAALRGRRVRRTFAV